ncbi:MAG: glycerol-3-phosphate dehydrogenase, partial [Halomonas sp.]|nr:glycerol-3-phosphate dehydrogenase [Halomonas sp.]
MSDQPMRVAVLGGGSFGTALASIAADNGAEVRQWLRDPELAAQINREHRNGRYLPDYAINPAVVAS